MDKKNIKIVHEFIDNSSRILVGTLCKRVELLEKEKVLTPALYKSIVKELIYENSRRLKDLLEVYFCVGTIKFKEKPKDSSKEE